MEKRILIVGAGPIAQEYLKITTALGLSPFIVCRDEKKALDIRNQYHCEAVGGGIENFLKTNSLTFILAINTTQIEFLFETNKILTKSNRVKRILTEKPGGLNLNQLEELYDLSQQFKKEIYIAYNRRFFASQLMLTQLLINESITSIDLEFTEWFWKIDVNNYSPEVLKEWMLANTSHVIDLTLHNGGNLNKLSSYTSDTKNFAGSPLQYSGSGIFSSGALFTYHADWESAGRWKIEISTKNGRYMLCPLEKLFFQKKGQLNYEEILIDSTLDQKWKPGFYLQTIEALKDNPIGLKTLKEQVISSKIYKTMSIGNQ